MNETKKLVYLTVMVPLISTATENINRFTQRKEREELHNNPTPQTEFYHSLQKCSEITAYFTFLPLFLTAQLVWFLRNDVMSPLSPDQKSAFLEFCCNGTNAYN